MEVQGHADGRFGPVRQCFAEILAAQPGTGAAFAAWCDDRLVVDLWGGHADLGRCRPWGADSLVQPYSVSKPFAAVCALRLVQDGRLDLDAPVQRYWPGFRAAATVRHVLSHQAGVVMLDRHGMGGLGGSYGGASTAGGYTVGFVTGSVGSHDRVDQLENTLRECLGLGPIPAA